MSFPDLLESPGSIHEYEPTKNEFRNFWNLVKDTYAVDPVMAKQYVDIIYDGGEKRYDALKLINKSPNMRNILQQLSPKLLDEIQITCDGCNQLFQALLETKDIMARHNDIKNYPHLLGALNTLSATYCANLLELGIDSDIWLKIDNIRDTGLLSELLSNMVFGDASYMIATGFLRLIDESTIDEFVALIDLYQTTHLDIIRIVDQGLNDKALVVDIHKIFMDNTIPLENKGVLLKGLTGFSVSNTQDKLMWQQKISSNLFTPSHTDIIDVLNFLLSIPQISILMGLLGLTVKFGNNGYTQVQVLLQAILGNGTEHPIIAAMSTWKGDAVALMIQDLVWTNQGEIFVAQKFLDFTAKLPETTLSQFLTVYLDSINQTYVFPHLIQSIETIPNKIYPYLCDDVGVISKDLILELQMLDSVTRTRLLTDGSAVLFRKLRKLEGLPFLLAGILQIGNVDDLSEKLEERYILDFLAKITLSGPGRQGVKNIAYAINALGNRQLIRALVPFISLKLLAMDRLSCDGDDQGREKSEVLVNAVCSVDGTIRKTFISGILDNNTMAEIVDGLLVRGAGETWKALSIFIHVIDSQSTEDSIVEQYNSFLLNDDNPYRFVRLISQIAHDDQKSAQYYSALMQQSPADRKQMIRDIMVFGKVELLFSGIMQGSEFQRWEDIRQKSEPIYQVLLILLAKAGDDHVKELGYIIQIKMRQNEGYKEILDNLSAQIDIQKIINFMTEIQNSSNFISILKEAFHEKIPAEVEACVRLVVKLYDKVMIIEALGKIPSSQAILLARAFAGDYDNLLNMLYQLHSTARSIQLLKRFCHENLKDANYPLSLCSNMMECLNGCPSAKMLQAFIDVKNINEDQVFFDFETVIGMMKPGNPQIIDHAKTLLQQQLFMFMIKLFSSEMRQKFLTEILGDVSDPIRTFYLLSPNIMLPLLITYRKVGDAPKIHMLCQTIAVTPEWIEILQYFTHSNKDPYSKLLMAIYALSVSEESEIDIQKIQRLKEAISCFVNLREALFRFAARSSIYPAELYTLIRYFLQGDSLCTSSGKINESFGFPQKQTIVFEDHWIYEQFLAAVDFSKKK